VIANWRSASESKHPRQKKLKEIFDTLDYFVFRLMLLGLVCVGAYALLIGHLH